MNIKEAIKNLESNGIYFKSDKKRLLRRKFSTKEINNALSEINAGEEK